MATVFMFTTTLLGQRPTASRCRGTAANSRSGIVAFSADDGVIEGNLIGFTGWNGIQLRGNGSNPLAGWTVRDNEIRGTGHERSLEDGIDLTNASNVLIQDNLIADNEGFGVDGFQSLGSNQIIGNSFVGNGLGGDNTGGVRTFGDNNLVQHNQFLSNQGAGVVVVGDGIDNGNTTVASVGDEITQNAFQANTGIAIDLVAASTDGTNPPNRFGDLVSENGVANDINAGNEGFDYPDLTSAVLEPSSALIIKGSADPSTNFDRFEIYLLSPTVATCTPTEKTTERALSTSDR